MSGRDGARRPALSTLVADIDPAWNAVVRTVRPIGRPGRPRDLWRLWRLSAGRQVLILQGSAPASSLYRDLVLAILIKLRPRRPRVLLTDATWELGSAALAKRFPLLAPILPIAMRVFLRLVDGTHVTYGVLSSEEVDSFPRQWGVPPHRVVLLEFGHTLWGDRFSEATSDGGYLFAGGNSLRDYALLEDAVAGTGLRTVVAAQWTPARPHAGFDARAVAEEEYFRLLAQCSVAVVPLRQAIRSAGQQTYLNAMALGKPVVVTEAPGVRDYIEDGVNGFIASATAEALRERLLEVTDSANAERVAAVAARGRADVLRKWTEFTYRQQLLRVTGL